jgi:hypothetical protein
MILLESVPRIENALEEFDKLNLQDEASIIIWLLKYENLRNNLRLFCVKDEFEPFQEGKFSILNNNKYYVDISKLAIVFVFYEKYIRLYRPIDEKFDFQVHSLETPVENRLRKLNIIKRPDDDYSDDKYVVDMDKLNEFNESNSNQ